jgi:hypothetical protein
VGGWGNRSSKAFGISFADRPKAKINKKNELAGHSWQQIVHQIVCRFIRKIARVDSPLAG